MQAALVRFGKTDITLASLVAVLVFVPLLITVRIPNTCVVLCLGFLAGLLASGISSSEPREFFASYVQIAGFIGAVVISLFVPVTRSFATSLKWLLFVSTCAAALIIVQAIFWNLFNSSLLTAPLGPLAPLGPGYEVYVPHPASPLKRPNGFFSEPSVAAWFMSFAYALSLSSRTIFRHSMLHTALFAIAAIATMTLSGVINVAVISLAAIWLNYRRLWRLGVIALLGGSMLLSLVGGVLLELIGRRAQEVFVEGTSTYYRVTAPTLLLKDSLYHYPFGHLLGGTGFIESKSFMVNWVRGATTNIDNSFFLIAYYFGLPGVLLGAGVLAYVFFVLASRREGALIALALVLAFSETGALWAPHMALIAGYGICVLRWLAFACERPSRCRGV